MAKCFNITVIWDFCFRFSFSMAGLKSTTADLGEGTVIHCWIPKTHKENKPNLLLIHGFGGNAMWQWREFVSSLIPHFNLYIPDLVFFGESHSSRPDRSDAFQARCLMAAMDALGVGKMNVAGMSYGGFVAYSMAAQFPERLEKLVLCATGVCLEDKDMEEGMFQVKSVDEAVSLLLPRTPEKMREMMSIAFAKPVKVIPDCLVNEFIDVLCTEHYEEKKDLILALHKDKKVSNLPKITQPTRIIWGEKDLVFPMELAHRLQRHIGGSTELEVIKEAGHAINIEKPKEMIKLIKSFLIDPLPSSKPIPHTINGHKVD